MEEGIEKTMKKENIFEDSQSIEFPLNPYWSFFSIKGIFSRQVAQFLGFTIFLLYAKK
jgi:hypothetical protein